MLDDIVDRTRSLFDAEKAGLWLLDDSDHPFTRAASRGLGEEFHARVHSLTLADTAVGVRSIRERRTAVVRDADTRSDVGAMQEMYAAEAIKTVWCRWSSTTARSACWASTTRDHDWPEDELALAQSSPTRRRSPSATRGCIGPWPTRRPGFVPSRTCRRG